MVSQSLLRVVSIAKSLEDLSGDVVFIGGAIAPLLQTHPAIPVIRATNDVDAVIASTSYSNFGLVQERLIALGFKLDLSNAKHANTWRAPDGTPFDLVSAGAHLGGTGNEWDQIALDSAVETELEAGLRIRHSSATGFLALKWAAFWDRGAEDPFSSHDLEDILALVISRDTIVSEFRNSESRIQDHIRLGLEWLTKSSDYEDLVAAHLNNAQDFRWVAQTLHDRFREMLEAAPLP